MKTIISCLLLSALVLSCPGQDETTVSFTYSNDLFGMAKQDDNRTSEMSIRVATESVVFDVQHSMLTDRVKGTRLDEATGKVGWKLDDITLGIGIRIRGDEAGQRAQNFVHHTLGQREENLVYDSHEALVLGWWEYEGAASFLRAKSSGDVMYDTFNADALVGLGWDWKYAGFSVLGGYEMYKTNSDSLTLKNVANGEDGLTSEVNARLLFLNFQLRTNHESGHCYGSFIFEYRL